MNNLSFALLTEPREWRWQSVECLVFLSRSWMSFVLNQWEQLTSVSQNKRSNMFDALTLNSRCPALVVTLHCSRTKLHVTLGQRKQLLRTGTDHAHTPSKQQRTYTGWRWCCVRVSNCPLIALQRGWYCVCFVWFVFVGWMLVSAMWSKNV